MADYVNLDSGGFTQEEFEDVQRCLETILAIRAGSQPLERELGIDYEGCIAYPANVAKNMLSVEIIEKIERYEPRVKVESVEFEGGGDGELVPVVKVGKA